MAVPAPDLTILRASATALQIKKYLENIIYFIIYPVVIYFSHYRSTKKLFVVFKSYYNTVIEFQQIFAYQQVKPEPDSPLRNGSAALQYYVLQVYDPRLCLYFRFYCKYGLAKSGFILGSEFCIHTH